MVSINDDVLERWGILTDAGQFDIDLQVRVRRGTTSRVVDVLREVIKERSPA